MPTAVRDVELKARHGDIEGLTGYARALVLLRWAGRPVGQLLLPVSDGRITAPDFEAALARNADWVFWFSWIREGLGWDDAPAPARVPATTVAVCTHDRPDDLRRCLDALMRLPDDGQEFLVVDNRPSTPATARLVAAYARVRYVRQDRGGLNAARNRALTEARGQIVAFTDDDATPDSHWLQMLVRNFAEPQVMCATGLVMPIELETDAQECFERYSPFGRGFARRTFDSFTTPVTAVAPVGAGANMALRRSVIEAVGPFDEALDAGTPTRSGGDHYMFGRILAAGYRIVYDPAALSWHRHRRTWDELHETVRGYGVGVYAMWTRWLLAEREFSVLKQAARWFVLGQLPELARSFGRRPRVPASVLLAELRGCVAGPRAYLRSRRRVQ